MKTLNSINRFVIKVKITGVVSYSFSLSLNVGVSMIDTADDGLHITCNEANVFHPSAGYEFHSCKDGFCVSVSLSKFVNPKLSSWF
jgi:hypothetical protein